MGNLYFVQLQAGLVEEFIDIRDFLAFYVSKIQKLYKAMRKHSKPSWL